MPPCEPKLAVCVCGTHRRPVIWRRGPASLLISLRCPVCHFRSHGARPELVDQAWNEAVRLAKQRSKSVDPHWDTEP